MSESYRTGRARYAVRGPPPRICVPTFCTRRAASKASNATHVRVEFAITC
ncbi:hypothetical protein BCh11DRAFT_06401 [Burkholderia sp. Ch1-1]|nr:hypothetical protein BCh11DRAFT_06401 [Burkholderia sp. Ch1-1]